MAIDRSTLSDALDAVHPVPVAGQGATVERFAVLAQFGATDLALARLAEGHLDALAICDEARYRPRDGLLGVWAADPPSAQLQARVGHHGWTLHGLKRWCSGASLLDRALVTAHADDGYRLFDVDLDTARVVRCGDSWNAVGMADSETLDVEFDAVPVARDQAVGGSDWYLHRRGFWVGGIGVAACWYGGALGAMHTLRDTLAAAGSDDPHAMAHLGAADALCAALRAQLRDAAAAVDNGVQGEPLRRLAWQVRAAVERLACDVLEHASRGLGAGALTRDRAMARRIADLPIYVRQHHAERDLAALGLLAVETSALPLGHVDG